MADFYIRSWDPASTYPPDPQEGDVCYTITLDQSWSPVAGVKNDNLLKEEVYENGEWKEVGGGGGGGDLKTVNVTLTANDYSTLDSYYENGYSGIFIGDTGFELAMLVTSEKPTLTEKMIIFGDSVVCGIYGAFISATGSAVWDAENEKLTISGDCSIVLESID